MSEVAYWCGINGQYVVPDAIVSLARMVQKRSTPPCADAFGTPPLPWTADSNSPGFRIVAEWGNWRDAQEQ